MSMGLIGQEEVGKKGVDSVEGRIKLVPRGVVGTGWV